MSHKESRKEFRYRDRWQSLGHLARIAFRDFSAVLARRLEPHGVTPGQWRFLRVLWEQDGLTQRELSERVRATEATTVRSIRSLLESKFVERRDDPLDQRKLRIFLTSRAKRLEAKLIPYVAEVHAIATRGISDADIETTRRVLRAVHDNFFAHHKEKAFDEDRFS